MDTSSLQQKLTQQLHLLPSQHELLNRLLFQLTFNDFQNIGLVGAEGSGKSTLALAIAELFSEQANVALLTVPVNESDIEQQLLQQWFGQRQAKPTLAEHLAAPLETAIPLLLVVDNFSQLSSSAQQKLLLIDCLGMFLLDKPSADMALNLSINMPTLQDAGQVLKDKPLDPLAIAERFAASAGNMHLLHSAVVKAEERQSRSAALWLIPAAVVMLIFAGFASWYLPTTDNTPTQPEPIVDMPLQQSTEVVENVMLPTPDTTVPDNAATDKLVLSEFSEIPVVSMPTAPPDDSVLQVEQTPVVLAENDPGAPPAEPDDQNDTTTPESAADQPQVDSSSQPSPEDVTVAGDLQLLALPAEFRVLQLAVLSSTVAVERFRQTFPNTKITVYQRSWQGQLQWVILAQQAYPDMASAREGRATLAEPLRAAGPFIKPVSAVQQEIKALTRIRNEAAAQE